MIPSADIIVIGGGCMGTSIALQLARHGAGRIVLLEKNEIASGATGRSSAIVRMHYAHEALARMALRARAVYEHFDELILANNGLVHLRGDASGQLPGGPGRSRRDGLGCDARLERRRNDRPRRIRSSEIILRQVGMPS